MKKWKQILRRAVAVLSAVAVFTAQVPDLRMKAYAVDPFTAMAGEEVVSYVISAIAAACGVNISSDSSDVAADVRFWTTQMKDDYEIRARVADKEVVKTVAAVSFVRAQEYFQSLADKTFTLVDNGLAVPRDVMDAVSAYFNSQAKAYTSDFTSTYQVVFTPGLVVGGTVDYVYEESGSLRRDRFILDENTGIACFKILNQMGGVTTCYAVFNYTGIESSYLLLSRYPYDSPDFDDLSSYGVNHIAPYGISLSSTNVGLSPGSAALMDCVGCLDLTSLGHIALNSAGWKTVFDVFRGKSLSVSVIDNGILAEPIPADNWQWSQMENAQTGTAEDVVILQPDAAPTEEELNQRLADALVAGLLGDLLEQLGIMAKEAEQPPEPSSSEEESSEPAVVPTDSPVPSESPSESLNPEPGGDPEPDGSLSQIVQLLEGIAAVPGQILDFFKIKPELIQEAYGDLADAFQGRFSGIKQLGSVFNVSRVFDRTVPYFTMPTPDPFKFAIDSPTIVVLDLRPFEDMFVWVRRILNAILWYAFASWFINQFDVKLHIG